MNLVRYVKLLWAVIFLTSIHNSYSESLKTTIDALINKQLPQATVGILVKDAKSGQVVFQKNADKLLAPASNIKLFTAAAALYYFKPEYKFNTTLAKKDQNYYITFGGSPSLKSKHFNKLFTALKKNNVTTINGNIIIDSSRFKSPEYTGGVSYDDLGWYYAAPDSAIVLDDNAEYYSITTAPKVGGLVQIKPKNPDPRLTLINQVTTVSKDEEKNHCNFNIEIKPNNTLRLYGCMAINKNPKVIQFAIPDPLLMAKQTIKKTLENNHLQLQGEIIAGVTPADAQIITILESNNLTRLVSHMLKESDNLYANNLTKQMAYALTKEGTYKQGAFAMKKILTEHTPVNFKHMELTDGMGTRYNLATPEQIVVLLSSVYNDKTLQAIFLDALPQSGISGTLKERMKKTLLEKKIFAKTGSMHDISSLSGFLVDPKTGTLIFSIVINGINKPIGVAKNLEEQILAAIAQKVASEPLLENAYG